MSRKAARQQVGVALFPFLAVLICTMGALIVLLVLLVQQARVDASTIVARQISSGGADDRRVRERLEDAQWQRELLEKSRAEKTEELAQSRARLAHLEEHAQRLEAQAKDLLERARAIDEGKRLRDEDLATARAEVERLKAEIERKKKELEETKRSHDGEEWYALIPYNGPAGTRRRPIYVECTEFGVIIQPEGILLGAQDFSGPMGPGNPLDVALRAAREHIERTAGDKAAQPYPLLVVRPSGVVAFGAAKAAIKAWDDEWGYELISDEKHLDFGPPDPALSAALSKQVAVARQRQAAMIAMMPRRYQGEEALKSFAAEEMVQQSAQQRSVGGESGGLGIGTGPGGGTGYGATGGSRGLGLPGGGKYPGGTESGFGGPGSPVARQPGGAGQGTGLPSATVAAGGSGGGGNFAQGFGPGANASGGAGSSGGTGQDAFPGSPLNSGGAGGSGYGGGGGQAGTGPTLGSPSGQSLAGGGGSQSSFGGSSGRAGQLGGLASSSAGGGNSSSLMSSGGQPGGSAFGGSTSPLGGQMGTPSPNLNLDFGGAKSGPSSSTSGSSTASASRSAPRSGANRGKNWALPGVQPHQIGVTRPIRISIQPDRIVMLPERGDNRAPQVVKIAPELTPDDVNHFVGAVQTEVKGWGLAVADGYWKPVLQAEVAPGAERHFMNLETALHGSGIDVIRR